MFATDYSNIARCAELRMDYLWQEACAARGIDWEPIHERRWREHETYRALRGKAFTVWNQRSSAI